MKSSVRMLIAMLVPLIAISAARGADLAEQEPVSGDHPCRQYDNAMTNVHYYKDLLATKNPEASDEERAFQKESFELHTARAARAKAACLAGNDSLSKTFRESERSDREKERRERSARDERERLSKLPSVRIGMTAQQVVEGSNWGRPNYTRRLTTAQGIREQWVYWGGRSLYFSDGKLVAIEE